MLDCWRIDSLFVRPSKKMLYVTKGRILCYVITYNVIWANHKTESFVYRLVMRTCNVFPHLSEHLLSFQAIRRYVSSSIAVQVIWWGTLGRDAAAEDVAADVNAGGAAWHDLTDVHSAQIRPCSQRVAGTVKSAYKEPAYKELPVIRNWFSLPNLYQGTTKHSSLYLSKELQFK